MRAQVTAFVIVGLVVLFTLGFSILLLTNLRQKDTRVIAQPEKTSLRQCLQDATEVSLQALGRQGGTPTGLTTLPSGGQMRVGIKNNYENLEPLCLWSGPNRPNATADNRNTCLAGTYQLREPSEAVLQYELEKSITTASAACGNDQPVTVIFGADDVSVTTQNASVIVPIRFKRIYNLAYRIAVLDVTQPQFDKKTSFVPGCIEGTSSNNCVLPGMVVTTAADGQYQLVRIADSKSTASGMPFIFEYAVENRPPVIIVPSDVATSRQVAIYDADEDILTVSGPGSYDAATHAFTFNTAANCTVSVSASDGKAAVVSASVYLGPDDGGTC